MYITLSKQPRKTNRGKTNRLLQPSLRIAHRISGSGRTARKHGDNHSDACRVARRFSYTGLPDGLSLHFRQGIFRQSMRHLIRAQTPVRRQNATTQR